MDYPEETVVNVPIYDGVRIDPSLILLVGEANTSRASGVAIRLQATRSCATTPL